MLSIAFVILSVVVVGGIALALLHLRGVTLNWALGALHGLAGAAGLAVLGAGGLRRPPPGCRAGAGHSWCAARWGRWHGGGVGRWRAVRALMGVGLAIAVHASLAISAYVLLLAYFALG